jgi:CRP-like cAMP-binding protein
VASFLTDDMLRESRAFGNLESSSRRLIAAMFRPVPTAPGHDLFPQGAHADCLYVLQDGELAVYRNTIEVERIGAPYLVGELSVLNALAPEDDEDPPVRHPVCVRAMSLSMLWELRMSDLHPLLNAHPHLQHDLCADVIEFIDRLWQQQPHEKCWKSLMARAKRRQAELEDPEADDPSVRAGEPEP